MSYGNNSINTRNIRVAKYNGSSLVCPMFFFPHFFYNCLIKMHILKKKIQLKSIKVKIQDTCIFIDKYLSWTKTNFLRRFVIGYVYIVSPFGTHTKYLAQYQRYHSGWILNPEAKEGTFQDIIWAFLYQLMNLVSTQK